VSAVPCWHGTAWKFKTKDFQDGITEEKQMLDFLQNLYEYLISLWFTLYLNHPDVALFFIAVAAVSLVVALMVLVDRVLKQTYPVPERVKQS
jgi:hypothetical protein